MMQDHLRHVAGVKTLVKTYELLLKKRFNISEPNPKKSIRILLTYQAIKQEQVNISPHLFILCGKIT